MTNGPPPVEPVAEAREIAKQIEVELLLLMTIRQALRIAVEWKPADAGNVRKLSTLRFVMSSFERHLNRMRVLADHGGYLHLVTHENPHLASEVLDLRNRRYELQAQWDGITLRLEQVLPESGEFAVLCGELETYLQDLETHGQHEMELFQHSFTQEEGGRG
jgi:hypothetical protein